jgi:hypothetical protein
MLGHEAGDGVDRSQSEAKSATASPRAIENEARANAHQPSDPVEVALGEALLRASRDGAWDAAQAIVDELRARRAARAGVVDLEAARAKRR